jgi:hypothetical protein
MPSQGLADLRRRASILAQGGGGSAEAPQGVDVHESGVQPPPPINDGIDTVRISFSTTSRACWRDAATSGDPVSSTIRATSSAV